MNDDTTLTTQPQTEVDVTKIDKATIKQLRKNVERLKSMHNVDTLKAAPHFDIRSFFPIGRTPHK